MHVHVPVHVPVDVPVSRILGRSRLKDFMHVPVWRIRCIVPSTCIIASEINGARIVPREDNGDGRLCCGQLEIVERRSHYFAFATPRLEPIHWGALRFDL
jgi:hypothetical protein